MKKIIKGFLIGTNIGIIISIIYNYALNTLFYSPASMDIVEKYGSNNTMLLLFVLSGIIGVVSSLSSIIYKNEKRSLLASSLIHYLVVFITVSIVGIVLNWFEFNLISFLIFLLIFTAIYFIVWTIFYLISKKEIKKLNKEIKNI